MISRGWNQRIVRVGVGSILLCSLWISCFSVCAEEKPPQVTPEQMLELQDALVEGIASKDWKLLKLAVKGYQVAGLDKAAVNVKIGDARQAAALALLQPQQRAQLEVWALGSKAQAGDKAARTKLVSYLKAKLIENPDPKTVDYDAYNLLTRRSTEAIIPLAQLNDPVVPEVIKEWLLATPADYTAMSKDLGIRKFQMITYSVYGRRTRKLAEAYKILSPDLPFNGVDKIVRSTEYPIKTRAGLFNGLVSGSTLNKDASEETKSQLRALFKGLVGELKGDETYASVGVLFRQMYSLDLEKDDTTFLAELEEKSTDRMVKKMVGQYRKVLAKRKEPKKPQEVAAKPIKKKDRKRPAREKKKPKSKTPIQPPQAPKEGDF